jgi:hypothetical protein
MVIYFKSEQKMAFRGEGLKLKNLTIYMDTINLPSVP